MKIVVAMSLVRDSKMKVRMLLISVTMGSFLAKCFNEFCGQFSFISSYKYLEVEI